MNVVNQRRIFVATEETIRSCVDSQLTRSKPLKIHNKKRKKDLLDRFECVVAAGFSAFVLSMVILTDLCGQFPIEI